MHKDRFIKTIIGAFLAVFLTFGTVAAWDDTYAQPTEKKAGKAESEKNTGTKEKHETAATKEKEVHAAAATHETAAISADEGLQKLVEGNQRYLSEKFLTDRYTGARRAEVAKGQHPFAIILSCSDSRVPPEILFNQGIGDLFVVRTAGHVADDDAVGSIEYAVEHLGVRLIMVLGHERCGAVDATVKGGEAPGHIAKVVEAVKPAVEKAKGKRGDLLDTIVGEHQTVLKSLGRFYEGVEGVSGATILGDGTVALILDIPKLLQIVEQEELSLP